MPRICLALLLAMGAAGYASKAPAADWTMTALVDGQPVEGKPFAWSRSVIQLLGSDGRLHEFSPGEAKNAKRRREPFRPLSSADVRKQLYREFGGGMEISSTSHYLVVHPPGASSAWAGRFEDVCRSLLSYLRVRGFSAREPEFPLVAVAFPNRGGYDRFVAQSGTKPIPGALGHYDHYSNRVVLYDVTGGDGDWTETAATVIHEATHQVAFNTGVHIRGADAPYWVPEGLAMLFEPRAVWRPRGSDTRADRINAERLDDFLHFSKDGQAPYSLAEFAATDEPFRRNAAAAYSQAWTLAFYLAETQPRQYSAYLASLAARPPLASYTAAERVADFRNAFGDDLAIVEANLMRWVRGLR
ncbi:MAG: DUF1570 domain-containing protein [Planctomycetota bacterium]